MPEYSIIQMVASRLPQIDTSLQVIKDLVGINALDVMNELERCFKVRYRSIIDGLIQNNDEVKDNERIENVGEETFYRQIERSIIADMVCMQYLFSESIKLSSSVEAEGATYLKRAKAGSAESEFAAVDIKNSPFMLSAVALMSKFKKDAERKALSIGCVIDVCDDCTFQAYLKNPEAFTPNTFLIVRSKCN